MIPTTLTRMGGVSVLAAASLLLAGCGGSTGSSSSEGTSGDCSSASVFCIGLVTDGGKIDDKSFNQSAYEGMQAAAKDLGGQSKYIQTTDSKDYASNIKQFTDKKYDVILTVGFNMADATTAAAKGSPSTKFIGVDQAQTSTVPNLTGLIFPEDQAGYAAGTLAGLMTKSNKVGMVLGQQIPPVERYAKGFEAGAKAADPNATTTLVYHQAGDTAFTDPAWGAAEAQKQLDQGVDVLFGAGGQTGNGALGQVAKAAGAGTTTFCIGVDTDQWLTVPEAHKCLVTSAEKDITSGTVELLKQAKAGSIKGGNFEGTVALAPFHDFDATIPAEVKTKVAAVVTGLKAGSIKTGVAAN